MSLTLKQHALQPDRVKLPLDFGLGNLDTYIVRVTYNETEGQGGETLHGPFSAQGAQTYARYRDDIGDTEVDNIEVLFINAPDDHV